MELRKTVLFVGAVLLLSGCGSTPVKNEPEKKPVLTKTEELHRKAKFTEAASMVGYDGKDIRKKLDKVIDETDRVNKELKAAGDL